MIVLIYKKRAATNHSLLLFNHITMDTIMYYLPLFNFLLIIVSTLYYIKEIVVPFKKQSHTKRTENIQITKGNYYRSWDNSKIEVNLDKANKALENKEYDKSIRFLYSAIKINMEIDTQCNVNLWNRIHEIENKLGL